MSTSLPTPSNARTVWRAGTVVPLAIFLLFILVALLALVGVSKASGFTFDLVFVAALVGFLSAVSLSRALMRGAR